MPRGEYPGRLKYITKTMAASKFKKWWNMGQEQMIITTQGDEE